MRITHWPVAGPVDSGLRMPRCRPITVHCPCSLGSMRAGLCVDALVGKAKPFHRPAIYKMLLHNLCCIFGANVAVPDCFGIDDNGGAVLALVEAPGFVDAHGAAQARSFGKLLQLRMQFAFSVGCARGPRSIRRTGIQTNKNVVFEGWQTSFLLSPDYRSLPAGNFSQLTPLDPPPSAKMIP